MPPWNKPARPKAAPVKAPAKPAAESPVHERGKEWEVVKLTGVRATKGRTAAGAPNYVYEVEWKGKYKNTYETRENLLAFAAVPRLPLDVGHGGASLLGGRPRLRRQAAERRGRHTLRPHIHQDERRLRGARAGGRWVLVGEGK